MNTNKVLFYKLNDHFKDNIRMSLLYNEILIIITKEDLFYGINNCNKKKSVFHYK